MMIIVEGVDGTGKTTLCRELSDRLGFPLYKAEVTPQTGGITVSESQNADVACPTPRIAAQAPEHVLARLRTAAATEDPDPDEA